MKPSGSNTLSVLSMGLGNRCHVELMKDEINTSFF